MDHQLNQRRFTVVQNQFLRIPRHLTSHPRSHHNGIWEPPRKCHVVLSILHQATQCLIHHLTTLASLTALKSSDRAPSSQYSSQYLCIGQVEWNRNKGARQEPEQTARPRDPPRIHGVREQRKRRPKQRPCQVIPRKHWR